MTTPQNLDQLIEGCRKNDRKSQEAIYNTFSRPMFRICLGYTDGDRDAAEDILQDGFIKVFTKIDGYTGEGPFGGWIRSIMVNTALSACRKNKLITRTHNEVVITDETWMVSKSDEQAILNIINTLPENQHTAFKLHVIEGYSHKEIAGMTGMTSPQSRTLVCRAKIQLREKILKMERMLASATFSGAC